MTLYFINCIVVPRPDKRCLSHCTVIFSGQQDVVFYDQRLSVTSHINCIVVHRPDKRCLSHCTVIFSGQHDVVLY